MRKALHRAAALLLAALLLPSLSACGEPDPNAGVYLCTEVAVGEDVVSPAELYNGEVRLELRDHGAGRLSLGENEGDLRWSIEGDTLSVDINGLSCPASLADGTIRLDLLGEGVVLTLVREELAALLPTPTPQPELFSRCVGEYYGWWEIEGSTGSMPDTWYDCCAAVVRTEDGLVLTLWDEQSSRMQPMGCLSLVGEGESLRLDGGWFWYDDLTEDNCAVSFEDGRFELNGQHDAEGERFAYRIHLRPWGADWEDTEERPYSYRFWYLPLIEAGESMPDTISGK